MNITFGYTFGARISDEDDQNLIATDDLYRAHANLARAIDRAWNAICDESTVLFVGALPSEL